MKILFGIILTALGFLSFSYGPIVGLLYLIFIVLLLNNI